MAVGRLGLRLWSEILGSLPHGCSHSFLAFLHNTVAQFQELVSQELQVEAVLPFMT